MKGDFLSYRVAAGRAVLGLVIQTVMTVALLVYAFLANDHAAMTVVIYSAMGLPVWLSLAIVFDQHRRERVEAMEAETLAEGVGSSSVFESDGGEFRVAKSRLSAMYRFLLPTMSVLVGGGLVAVGFWRLSGARDLFPLDMFGKPTMPVWGLGLGSVIAFVGFIFARYVSGMAKQAVWQNLRAGAAWAAGTALMGLLLAAAAALHLARADVFSRYILVIFPAVMILLGLEVFLNLLLNLYRPRRAGEVPRPAFDSRVLGFVAAPDKIAESISEAINYQLGFDVSSTWFYRLLSRSIGRLVVLGVAVLWLLSCMAVVQPHERGLVLRFGRVVQDNVGPGLHFKLPWPIDRVEIPADTRKNERGRVEVIGYTATGVRTVNLGTLPPADDKKAILWTNEHARDEVYQIVQASPGDAAQDASSSGDGTRDLAMVSAEIPLRYAVSDVMLFEELAPVEFREDLLRSVAQRVIVEYFTSTNVDQILGGDQTEISRELRRRVGEAFDNLNPDPATGKPRGAGVEILFLGLTDVHPPKDAAANFERVVQAEQLRQASIEAAEAEAIASLTQVVGRLDLAKEIVVELKELDRMKAAAAKTGAVPEQEAKILSLIGTAGGTAAEEIARARADRWQRHMGERGRLALYRGQTASYEASPLYYKSLLYLDALGEAMSRSRLYIVSDKVANLWFDFDLKDTSASANVLDTNREKIE